jgi:DNA-binding MarR family transcriptional regulator
VEIALDHVGLSLPQYRVLIILEKGSTAASALASNLVVSPPSVTALVDGLVTRGFVERVSVTGDRRRVEHILTDKGRKALAEADAAVNDRMEEIAGYLPAGERSKVVTGLQLWLRAMDAYVESRVREKLASSR